MKMPYQPHCLHAFPAAAQGRGLWRAEAVAALQGGMHNRNAFLAFARHFNESAARAAHLKCP